MIEKCPKPQDQVYVKRKRRILIWLLIIAACYGGIIFLIPEDSTSDRVTDYLLGLPFLFLIVAWCHYDALQRRYFMSRSMKVCLVLLLGLAFPVYLFKSRGLGGFKTLGYAGLFLVAMLATAILAAIVTAMVMVCLPPIMGVLKFILFLLEKVLIMNLTGYGYFQ